MSKDLRVKLLMELLWLFVTVLVIAVVYLPFWGVMRRIPFWVENIASLITLVTLTRFIFFLPYTLFAKTIIPKVIMMFAILPLGLYILRWQSQFSTFLTQQGLMGFDSFFEDGVGMTERLDTFRYFSKVFMFSTSAALIACIAFFFRMILSIWRTHNKTGI